ncbi:MAG TPA: fibronectin type III domain-containing protein [Nitrospirae bacterium]|nr:fibronectin type III domain-containing protein [Nitrospirota bacterium]
MLKRFPAKKTILPALIIFLSLFILTLTADAATITWSGGGADNLASNTANWSGNALPQDGDDLVFDSTSTKECTWDIYVTPLTLTIDAAYTGTITLNTELTVTGDVVITGGTFNQESKDFRIGFGAAEAPPYPPTGLTAAATSASQIDIAWTDNSGNETGFKIERKTGSGGTYSQTATVGADVTAYADTVLTPGTTYYYRVNAYNTAGDSGYSNEAGATTDSSPTVSTSAPTNLNGISATLNATVNPNGSETTVYFEWGTDISYGNSTPTQSIGSGTEDVSVSADITGLTPNITYHYMVTASNTAGTANGADVSFTTPPITLTITSPLDGATINRSDVMVKGTVTNTTDNETGVIVNGVATVGYNGEFIVNHVPLEEGDNTITASATDTDGYTASVSITVNAVTTDPHVILRANIESGIAPLTTYFSVSTNIPNSVANYEFDYEGDGTIDYTGAAFDNISVTYSTEYIYYPTITVTDDQSNTYSDTIAIIVLNQAELDTLLRSKWEAMRAALAVQDITTALTYISSGARTSYEEMFNAITDQLPSITATQTDFNFISATDNLVKYELVTMENDTTYSYDVIFIKNKDGIWMILEY